MGGVFDARDLATEGAARVHNRLICIQPSDFRILPRNRAAGENQPARTFLLGECELRVR